MESFLVIGQSAASSMSNLMLIGSLALLPVALVIGWLADYRLQSRVAIKNARLLSGILVFGMLMSVIGFSFQDSLES